MAHDSVCGPSESIPPPPGHTGQRPRVIGAGAKTRASRRHLITAAILIQTFVLGAGWYVAYTDIKGQTAEAVERLVLAQNVGIADAVGDVIAEMGDQRIEYGTPQWQRLQKIVEEVKLSSGGFVCVLDSENKVLCHPQLRKTPGLLGMPMAGKVLTQLNGQSVTIGQADKTQTLAGRLALNQTDTHYVATKRLPNIQGRLMVHQPQRGLTAAGNLATGGFVLPAAITGAAVLIVTTLIVSLLMRRHDRTIETINLELEDEVHRRVAKAVSTRGALIIGLAKLADYRDTDTGLHLDRIATYSVMLAQELRDRFAEIDDRWIEMLRVASTMHDIGKVGIPDAILLKPGKLTPQERQTMQRHPVIGTDTLVAVRQAMGEDDLVEMSIRIALYHHERWDGQGYPTNLPGDQIPLEARIVAVADVYDALASKRVYKDAIPHAKITETLRGDAGTQFDPAVIEAFLRIESAFDQVRERLTPPDAQSSNAA